MTSYILRFIFILLKEVMLSNLYSMKRIVLLAIVSINLLWNSSVFCQTGPAGIGNSGSNPLWLDADRFNGPAGASWYWNDVSGNNNNASSTLFAGRPAWTAAQLNGFPAFTFDGVNDHFQTNGLPGLNTRNSTWFVVGRTNTMATRQSYVHFSHSTSAPHNSYRFTMVYPPYGTLSGMTKTTGTAALLVHGSSTSFTLMEAVTSTALASSYTNGTLSANNIGPFNVPANNIRTSIGRRGYIQDAYLNGEVAEVIVFNYTLGNAERIIVENYISSKYALGILAASDKYAYEGTGHYFELAGIGQEPGNSVTTAQGTGIVEFNSPSSISDGDYLLWAHDNTALTAQFTNIPNTYPILSGTVITRTWRVGKTNDLGTVSVEVDLTGIEFGDPTSYELLIDADGDFTTGAVRHTTGYTYNAGVITFTDVDFTDGDFFTIGNPNGDIISITTGPWSNQNTWNCTCVPDNTVSATIDSGDIVTVDVASSIINLTINATGTLDFSASSTLTVDGDLAIEGTLTGLNGTVTFAGAALQSVSGNGTATWDNLTLNNGFGMILTGGTHTLRSDLTITDGEFDINNQSFTLLSTAARTARIAPVGATGSIAGRLTVQRFISARADGTSTMASPVSDATFDEWADDLELLFVPYVEFVSIPSIFTYDESEFDYVPIENSGDNIKVAIGYEVYLDNDGSAGTPFSATTLTTFGSPNFGNIDASQDMYMDNDGWNLIGNPYASSISYVSFQTASGGSINTTWMFYNEVIGDYSSVTGGIIAPHQGFWVEVLSMPVTATFTESMKSNQMTTTFRNYEEALFGIRLSSDGINKFTSNTHFRFNPSASLAYEAGSDLSFKKVPNANAPALFTLSTEGKKLRINELSDEEELTIPLNFDVNVSGYYFLSANELEQVYEMGYNCAVIEDTRTNQIFDLSAGNYRFYADKDEANDRFVLKLSKTANNCRMSESALVDLEPEGVSILKNENGLYVNFELEEMQNASITVINTLGQNIINPINQNLKEQNVKIYLPADYTGVFLINVRVGDKMITRKFFN